MVRIPLNREEAQASGFIIACATLLIEGKQLTLGATTQEELDATLAEVRTVASEIKKW